MRRVAVLLRLELRRKLRDPVSMVVWMVIPFFMVGLMAAVFGPRGQGSLPKVTMLVVDHDQGLISRLLESALTSQELAASLDVKIVGEPEARRIMDRGKASLMVVIPEGFSEGFFKKRPLEIRVFRNPQESILPKIGTDVIGFLADAGGALRSALLPLTRGVIDLDGDTKPTLARVKALSARIYTILNNPAAGRLLHGDALKVVDRHAERNTVSHSQVIGWFAPGIVAMALLFLSTGQSQEIQEDLISGRLARAWTFPSRPWIALGAKTAALVVTASASAALLVLALSGVLGWRVGHVLLLIVHIGAVAAAFSGLALLLRSLTKNPEAGGAAASGVMVGLGFLGGCFVPVIFLPPFLRSVANVIPTGWAVQGFLILEGATWAGDLGSIWPRIVALLLTAIVSLAAAGWLIRRKAMLG
jgi:ABC-2 type transport system permease protein